jgi:H/ACA ribonucleoprotein complex subunit 4
MGKVEEVDFSIKPENVTPQIPTSEWPLLLKNYDKCMGNSIGNHVPPTF